MKIGLHLPQIGGSSADLARIDRFDTEVRPRLA